jgi:glycosyltransferase involved in cell wall biosynthesis
MTALSVDQSIEILSSAAPAETSVVTLSIIIPVFNEEATILELLDKVYASVLPNIKKEIIVVDDRSTDGTYKRLLGSSIPTKLIRHTCNQGKGAAVRTGFKAASGDILLIQDADLEYEPNDYAALIAPILRNEADAVLGSRFQQHKPRFLTADGEPFFSHYIGNQLIILFTNFLYGFRATDYEGCYKAFTRALIEQIPVHADSFEFDNELICKVLRRKYRVTEVPIHYYPRDYRQGKKIHWYHGLRMLWTIIKWRFKRF